MTAQAAPRGATAADRLLADIGHQDVLSTSSSTWPICGDIEMPDGGGVPVDPAALGAADRHRLARLADLLNWAYGFALPPRAGGVRRNAPSAGRRYPIEILCVAQLRGAWALLHFDFARQRFVHRPVRAGRLDEPFALRPGEVAIVLTAVLWRTMQRYGVRGYRYCLFEAGCIASNVGELLAASAGDERCSFAAVPRAFDARLGLPPEVPVLCAGVVRERALASLPAYPAPAPAPPAASLREASPVLSPQLIRVERFHDRVREGERCAVHAVSVLRGERYFERVARRCSARDFARGALDPAVRPALARLVHDYARAEAQRYGHSLTGVLLATSDGRALAPTALVIDADGVREHRLDPGPGWDELAARVFQNQQIVKRAGGLLAIGVSAAGTASHRAFAQSCLRAGVLGAELYRYGAATGLGTTTIGGFSDRLLQRLLGFADVFPLLVQAFGAATEGEKVDAAVWPALGRRPAEVPG